VLRPYGRRPRGECAKCRSKERTRTIFALLKKLEVLDRRYSVLHIAPEPALAARLSETYGGNYTIADIREDALAKFDGKIERLLLDVTRLSDAVKSRRFDIIIHSHVMEHVRGSWPVAFLRLHALLKPDGWHVFAVPIMRDWSKEDLADMTADERHRRFGQHDHMRYIGRHDFDNDMHTVAELTGATYFRPATAFLSEADMHRIAGDADVYVMRKSSTRSGFDA
jgi:SAM-dependent methyltransferase